MSSRRQFLAGMGVLGTSTLLGQGRGQTALTANIGKGRRIDVHHHYAPKTWQDAMVRDAAVRTATGQTRMECSGLPWGIRESTVSRSYPWSPGVQVVKAGRAAVLAR